jgi:hypothetical protein
MNGNGPSSTVQTVVLKLLIVPSTAPWMRSPDGPAPRFGSCFFVLKPDVLQRPTFTFGGSQADPKYRGTVEEFHGILDAAFEECFTWDFALGMTNIRPSKLMERIIKLNNPVQNETSPSRNLGHYVEALVHSDVLLERDILELVADPPFHGTDTGPDLETMSLKYEFHLCWHQGFRMQIVLVPKDFRGPTMPSLAARIAENGLIDGKAIGTAVRELSRDPEAWKDRGTHPEALQELKLLWHLLVRVGNEVE